MSIKRVRSRRRVATLVAATAIASCRSDSIGPRGPTTLTFLSSPSTTTVGLPIKPAVRVAILDNGGFIMAGATNTVTLTIANNAGATLSGTTSVSAVNGVATFSDLSIDKPAAQYALIASSSDLQSAISESFKITGPSRLAFIAAPDGGAPGAAIAPAIQVAIQDELGNTVPVAANTITLSLGTNPAGATLLGTTTVNAVNGVATFSDISIDKPGAQYTLVASSNTLTSVISNPFTVSAPSKLAFTVPPSGKAVGVVISPAVQVSIQDDIGNVVHNATNAVTISFGTNPAGASLSGTKTVNAVSGVATFSDLSIDRAGSGYTLIASSTGLAPATSPAFSINAGPPAMHVTTTTTGTGIPAHFTLSVDCDSYGCLYSSFVNPNDAVNVVVGAGEHFVSLYVPDNCDVAGGASRNVTVTGPTEVQFAVSCGALGTLNITTNTSGADATPDSYSVCVDRADNPCFWRRDLRPTDAISITGVISGAHNVSLVNVGGNCTVSGGTTHVVNVLGNATVNAPFDLNCASTERIAFSSAGTISMMHVDGTARHFITAGTAPAWSPDGARLAYECGTDICTINADGSGPNRLTLGGAVNRHPGWSPDGAKIVFASTSSGATDLYVASAVSGNPVRLTQSAGVVGNPTWSPDGTQIAFDCQVDPGNYDICVVNSDGTGFARLTSDPARDYGAAWKPDGSTLAFATARFGFDEIVLMSRVGGTVSRIGGGLSGFTPTWSPDGAQLAFAMLYNDPVLGVQEAIVVARSDGSNIRSIATGAQPAWRPHR